MKQCMNCKGSGCMNCQVWTEPPHTLSPEQIRNRLEFGTPDHPLKGIYGEEGDFWGQRLVHDEDCLDCEECPRECKKMVSE